MPMLNNNCGTRPRPDRTILPGCKLQVIWDDGIELRYATEIYVALPLHIRAGRSARQVAEFLVRQAAMHEALLGNIENEVLHDLLNAEGGAPFLIAAIECEGGALLLGEVFGLFQKEATP